MQCGNASDGEAPGRVITLAVDCGLDELKMLVDCHNDVHITYTSLEDVEMVSFVNFSQPFG